MAACQPDALIERSADILVALVLNVDGEDYGSSAVDALGEIVGEALARGRIELATRVLSTIASSVQAGGTRSREHVQHLALLQQRLAGRTHIALVGGLLRQHGSNERQLTLTAQYLGLVATQAIQEFTALLAEERDRQVRARMCQVLAKVGMPAVPILLDWLEDPRWFLVRNVVHVLGKIGDEAVFGPVVLLLGHPHARVRIEAVRALALVAPARAAAPLVQLVAGRRPGGPGRGDAGARGASAGRGRPDPAGCGGRGGGRCADLALRQEAVERSGGDRDAGSCEALASLARRHVWLWKRTERRFREIAAAALAARTDDEELPMSDAPRPDPQLIFTYLHGMLRAAGLYLPTHPQTRRAKLTLFDALTAYLAGQGRLTYRFMGDLLVANDRILPRESLLYRRFLETCQTRARPRRRRASHRGSRSASSTSSWRP